MTKSDFAWASAAVVSMLLYRPLRFWAENAWTLSAPPDLFKVVGLQVVVAIALLAASSLLPIRSAIVTVTVSWTAFLAMNWSAVGAPTALAIILLVGVAVIVASLRFASVTPRAIAYVAMLAMVATPLVQLAAAHIQQRPSFPVASFAEPGAVTASQKVSDVLLLVVDGYPMRKVARDMFGHDTSALAAHLEASGFAVPEISWSHNTFTGLAIPGILSLDQVADPDSSVGWRNQKDNYAMSRGDNRSVQIFRSAGFRYTHIESGWNGDVCGSPDVCLHSDLIDEANWKLLEQSAFIGPMERRWGSQNAMNAFTSLDHLLEPGLFNDDQPGFVYAHVMLPHPPEVVSRTCAVLPLSSRGSSPSHIRDQLACVDSMLLKVIDSLDDDIAVLITADHGTATRGQLFKPGEEWSDDDILERMGALLAYRLPGVCEPPARETNVEAMRAIVSCATEFKVPSTEASYVIGLDELTEVSSDRVRSITQSASRS